MTREGANDWRAFANALAQAIAALERGQASEPLMEALKNAEAQDRSMPVRCLIWADALDSRKRALLWLAGRDDASLAAIFASPVTLRVNFVERGFYFSAGASEPQIVGGAPALAQLVEDARSRGEDPPYRVGVEVDPQRSGLEIIAPAQIQFDEGARELSDGQTIVVLALNGSGAARSADANTRDEILQNALAVVPVFTSGLNPSRAEFASTSVIAAPPINISTIAAKPASALLPASSTDVRRQLGVVQSGRRLFRLGGVARERLAADLEQLTVRLRREQRTERAAQGASREQELRLILDQRRVAVSDDFGRIINAVRESSKRTKTRAGAVRQVIDGLIESVREDDIDREPQGKTFRLSLDPGLSAEFRSRLLQALKRHVADDIVLIRDSLDVLRGNIEQTLEEIGAPSRGFVLTAPTVDAVWPRLEELVDLELKYRGEIPRRGFMASLGEGRRVIFLIMMVISLVGGFLGFNLRQVWWIGLILLGVFVVSAFFALRSWRQEDESVIAREIDRIRDQLKSVLDKTVEDVLREELSAMQSVLDETKRNALLALDDIWRQTVSALSRGAAEERDAARSRIRGIETKIASLKIIERDLDKALGDAAKQLSAERQTLQKALEAEAAQV